MYYGEIWDNKMNVNPSVRIPQMCLFATGCAESTRTVRAHSKACGACEQTCLSVAVVEMPHHGWRVLHQLL